MENSPEASPYDEPSKTKLEDHEIAELNRTAIGGGPELTEQDQRELREAILNKNKDSKPKDSAEEHAA